MAHCDAAAMRARMAQVEQEHAQFQRIKQELEAERQKFQKVRQHMEKELQAKEKLLQAARGKRQKLLKEVQECDDEIAKLEEEKRVLSDQMFSATAEAEDVEKNVFGRLGIPVPGQAGPVAGAPAVMQPTPVLQQVPPGQGVAPDLIGLADLWQATPQPTPAALSAPLAGLAPPPQEQDLLGFCAAPAAPSAPPPQQQQGLGGLLPGSGSAGPALGFPGGQLHGQGQLSSLDPGLFGPPAAGQAPYQAPMPGHAPSAMAPGGVPYPPGYGVPQRPQPPPPPPPGAAATAAAPPSAGLDFDSLLMGPLGR